MGKKRKQEQRRDDSSSSDAKRCRSWQNGETSRPSDRMPLEGSSDIFASIRDVLIQFKDIIQVKVSTEEKLKRKIVKLEKKREKDKNKYKEDLSMLKEDLKKELKEEFMEELKLKIQEEMRKEGCAKVHHDSASPSQRSQQQSQTTRFRLEIKSTVRSTVYKGKTIRTDDGDRIEVVMYDGVNPIAYGHPLSSITVQLVVVEGEFNECNQEFWSKEDFEKSIIKPRQGNPRLVKNGRFKLINGSRVHEGAVITDNSNRKDVKLGVMIGEHREERVLEGVSNPFRVQEAKTQDRGKRKGSATDDTAKDLLRHTGQSSTQLTCIQINKNGKMPVSNGQELNLPQVPMPNSSLTPEGLIGYDKRLSFRPAIMQNSSQLTTIQIEGNGQALNGNVQQCSPQVPIQICSQPSSIQAMRHGDGPVGQLTLDCGQQQYTSYYNASAHWQNTPFLNLPEDSLMSVNKTYDFQTSQWPSITEGHHPSAGDVHHLDAQTQNQVTYGSLRIGQVLLLWDKPDVEPRQSWNLLDQLMPLYTRHSSICSRSFPSTSLMDKVHMLLSSSSLGDSAVKMMRGLRITRVTSRAMQTPQKRGILIRPIEPYDPDDEPPVKRQRHAKYQLRFVNRVCNDYYTWEQIKSDDGDLLMVALYDENNLRITAGLLSSASVEVVLLHGDFNADGQDYWTSEEFNSCILGPQSGKERPALGGDRVLVLTDGEANLCNANFQKTSFHARTGKFKMGVRMIVNLEERVQEGITEPFIVRNRQGGGSNINSDSLLSEAPVALRKLSKDCTTLERDDIFPLRDLPKFCKVSALEEIKILVNQSSPLPSSLGPHEILPKKSGPPEGNILVVRRLQGSIDPSKRWRIVSKAIFFLVRLKAGTQRNKWRTLQQDSSCYSPITVDWLQGSIDPSERWRIVTKAIFFLERLKTGTQRNKLRTLQQDSSCYSTATVDSNECSFSCETDFCNNSIGRRLQGSIDPSERWRVVTKAILFLVRLKAGTQRNKWRTLQLLNEQDSSCYSTATVDTNECSFSCETDFCNNSIGQRLQGSIDPSERWRIVTKAIIFLVRLRTKTQRIKWRNLQQDPEYLNWPGFQLLL